MPNSINNTCSGNPEWRTPDAIIDSARITMGSIDCDPATFAAAQLHVNAGVHFTKVTNGLEKAWIGSVWLNPPYHSSNTKKGPGIDAFAAKLLNEVGCGNTTQAIFLAQSKTDTQWYQRLYEKADAVMLTRKRIKFVDADGRQGAAPAFGSVFFYFGNDAAKFISIFSNIAYKAK